MKKLGDEPMSQKERTRKYYEDNNLVLFACRIDKRLVDRLVTKLDTLGVSKRQFLITAIEKFLKRG